MTVGELLQTLLTPTPKFLLWMFAKRFIAGKNKAEAFSRAGMLNEAGFRVSLDYIGEGCADRIRAQWVKLEYLSLLSTIKERGIQGDISVKLSHLGLFHEDAALAGFGESAFAEILFQAERTEIRVWIDAEELKHRSRTWKIVAKYEVFRSNLGVCVQAYAEDAAPFFTDHMRGLKNGAQGLAIRVCKGAYHESGHRLLIGKALDDNFLRLCAATSAYGCFLQAATHDERLIRCLKGFPDEYGMLLGVNPALANALLQEGKQVNIYTAYGPNYKPYILRRIAERPSYIFLPFRR